MEKQTLAATFWIKPFGPPLSLCASTLLHFVPMVHFYPLPVRSSHIPSCSPPKSKPLNPPSTTHPLKMTRSMAIFYLTPIKQGGFSALISL